ncbi:EAL domain-containing protein [Piscinibacter sp.]|uniref:EAL domain-containing protein n=1 Tax=Piscinibacter sp. TaxID=1903157 RepID=UPI002F402BDD
MDSLVKVLMVEAVAFDADMLKRIIKRSGLMFAAERVDTLQAFEAALARFEPDIVLSDFAMPGFDGMQALQTLRRLRPETPFVFVSRTVGEERAVEALREGAADYVLKDNASRLVPAIRRALDEAEERRRQRRLKADLEQSEARFRVLLDHIPGPVVMKDAEGRYTYANREVQRIVGKGLDEIVGHKTAEIFRQERAAEYLHNDRAALSSEAGIEVTERVEVDGESRVFLSRRFALPGGAGEPPTVAAVSVDVTERVRQEERIARLQRMRAVLSGINTTIVRVRDRDELFREACRVAIDAGGFHMAWIGLAEPGHHKVRPVAWDGFVQGYLDVVGRSLADVPQTAPTAGVELAHVTEDEGLAGRALRTRQVIVSNDIANDPEVKFKHEALSRGYRGLVALPLVVQGEAVGVMTLYTTQTGLFDRRELALLKRLTGAVSFAIDNLDKSERLAFAAHYDPLTAVANRPLFFDRLKQMLRVADPWDASLTLMVFDLQRFHELNDSLGRETGDRVLRNFANRLREVFGESGALGRTSGDRFGVAVPANLSAVLALLTEPQAVPSLAEPTVVDGVPIVPAFRIGVASFPADGKTHEALFHNAEAALQRAKERNEPWVFYAAEMNADVARRVSLDRELRLAAQARQFSLLYQPKVDLASEAIVGMEALIRWRTSDGEDVPPLTFVPMLDDTGLIVSVGRWVIEQALRDAAAWAAAGVAVPPIAVNVSPVQLRHRDFVATVLGAIGDAEGRPAKIDLEITESHVMGDAQASVAKLRELRAAGTKVLMDDFGTGVSSLSQLARLPLDALKIDRAFVRDLVDSAEQTAIVTAILALARALRLQVVAEGVETPAQARKLQSLGCDQAQGYLYGKPLSADDMLGRLRAGRVATPART